MWLLAQSLHPGPIRVRPRRVSVPSHVLTSGVPVNGQSRGSFGIRGPTRIRGAAKHRDSLWRTHVRAGQPLRRCPGRGGRSLRPGPEGPGLCMFHLHARSTAQPFSAGLLLSHSRAHLSVPSPRGSLVGSARSRGPPSLRDQGSGVGTEHGYLRPTPSQGDRQTGFLEGLWPCWTCLLLTPALGL